MSSLFVVYFLDFFVFLYFTIYTHCILSQIKVSGYKELLEKIHIKSMEETDINIILPNSIGEKLYKIYEKL